MPTIDIDYALADSQVPASGFIANGTWDNATPPAITCTMKSTAGDVPGTTTTDNSLKTWTATFGTLTGTATYTLRAEFTGASPAEEPNIRVLGTNVPVIAIDGVTVIVTVDSDPNRATYSYKVSGSYDKANAGKGGVCLAVTRTGNNKKIQSIDAAQPIPMPGNSGNWTVTFTFSGGQVPQGKKLEFVALMINEDAAPVSRSGRKGPKRP